MKKIKTKVGNKVMGTMMTICGTILIGLLLNSNCRGTSYPQECTIVYTNEDCAEIIRDLKELLYANEMALNHAEKLIENNNLLDKDGSDDMVEYLEWEAKIDSLTTNL